MGYRLAGSIPSTNRSDRADPRETRVLDYTYAAAGGDRRSSSKSGVDAVLVDLSKFDVKVAVAYARGTGNFGSKAADVKKQSSDRSTRHRPDHPGGVDVTV